MKLREAPQPVGNTRVLAVSSNVSYTWENSQPAGAAPGKGSRVVVSSIRINGQPIDLEKTYRVTASGYVADGNNNMTVMMEGTNAQDGRLDLDVAKDFFKAFNLIQYPQVNRVTKIN